MYGHKVLFRSLVLGLKLFLQLLLIFSHFIKQSNFLNLLTILLLLFHVLWQWMRLLNLIIFLMTWLQGETEQNHCLNRNKLFCANIGVDAWSVHQQLFAILSILKRLNSYGFGLTHRLSFSAHVD
jgi:hypothetical protein